MRALGERLKQLCEEFPGRDGANTVFETTYDRKTKRFEVRQRRLNWLTGVYEPEDFGSPNIGPMPNDIEQALKLSNDMVSALQAELAEAHQSINDLRVRAELAEAASTKQREIIADAEWPYADGYGHVCPWCGALGIGDVNVKDEDKATTPHKVECDAAEVMGWERKP
jgi:hypothetical protein